MSTTIGRLADPPLQTPLVERDKAQQLTGLITKAWNSWLLSLVSRLSSVATVLRVTTKLAQAAAIATTAAWTTQAAALYRVTYIVRVTQAATTSSSLTVTLGWLRSGVAMTVAGAAIVNGGPTSGQTGSALVRADDKSDLTFAIAYASVGATPMLYELDVVVEQVPQV